MKDRRRHHPGARRHRAAPKTRKSHRSPKCPGTHTPHTIPSMAKKRCHDPPLVHAPARPEAAPFAQ